MSPEGRGTRGRASRALQDLVEVRAASGGCRRSGGCLGDSRRIRRIRRDALRIADRDHPNQRASHQALAQEPVHRNGPQRVQRLPVHSRETTWLRREAALGSQVGQRTATDAVANWVGGSADDGPVGDELGWVPLRACPPDNAAEGVVEPDRVLEVARRMVLAAEQAGQAAQRSVPPNRRRRQTVGSACGWRHRSHARPVGGAGCRAVSRHRPWVRAADGACPASVPDRAEAGRSDRGGRRRACGGLLHRAVDQCRMSFRRARAGEVVRR